MKSLYVERWASGSLRSRSIGTCRIRIVRHAPMYTSRMVLTYSTLLLYRHQAACLPRQRVRHYQRDASNTAFGDVDKLNAVRSCFGATSETQPTASRVSLVAQLRLVALHIIDKNWCNIALNYSCRNQL